MLIRTIMIIVAILALTACGRGRGHVAVKASASTPSAHVVAKHHYTYYPNGEAYFSVADSVWFWYHGGTWHSGVNLPSSIQVTLGSDKIALELDVDHPRHVHPEIKRKHPGKPPAHAPAHGVKGTSPSQGQGQGQGHGHAHGHDKDDHPGKAKGKDKDKDKKDKKDK